MNIRIFDHIYIKPPKNKIYKRLGYKEGVTDLSCEKAREMDRYIDEASFLIALRGCAVRIAIDDCSAAGVVLSNDITFDSKLVGRFLHGCKEILIMAVTAGHKIMEAISISKDGDLAKGVVFDAVASEMTDAAFDWITSYYAVQLQPEFRQLLDKRISCGYGDFSLDYQKAIHELLEMDKLNIFLTDSNMLVPEKSATAITGVIDKKNEEE